MCGADSGLSDRSSRGMGSPPRVRSRQSARPFHPARQGITSACAEQTDTTRPERRRPRDHLRVCGADVGPNVSVPGHWGSPPRVRSRLFHRGRCRSTRRITSACAEQTISWRRPTRRTRDHLRVCGADTGEALEAAVAGGSPPRVRSRLGLPSPRRFTRGITSACAEQTDNPSPRIARSRDHLRVCGADRSRRSRTQTGGGSPPRVRSRPGRPMGEDRRPGITSACAEQTAM